METNLAPLTEPMIINDVYASGLAGIEDVGDGNYRFTLFAYKRTVHGTEERVVVDHIIFPGQAARDAALMTLSVIGHKFLRTCAQCFGMTRH